MKKRLSSAMPRFSERTLAFIQTASRQKHPGWLDQHRADYEAHILAPLQNLAKTLKAELGPVAGGYHFPQKGIGRIKRVRPAERAPGRVAGALYKDWISYSASRPAKSRFDHNPNLFFMIHPFDEDGQYVLVAGGLYMPSSRQLRAIRERIANDSDYAAQCDRLFSSKSFAARFAGGFSPEKKSSRVPRGFDPEHPRLDWLKLQAYFVWRPYSKREFSSVQFPKLVTQDFKQILRLNALLEQALGGAPRLTPNRSKAPKKLSNLSSRLDELAPAPREMDF